RTGKTTESTRQAATPAGEPAPSLRSGQALSEANGTPALPLHHSAFIVHNLSTKVAMRWCSAITVSARFLALATVAIAAPAGVVSGRTAQSAAKGRALSAPLAAIRSEEHTSELQSRS